MEKARLRQNFAALRDKLPAQARKEKSRLISQLILKLKEVQAARTIAGYFPIRSEVDLRPALKELLNTGTTLVLPKVSAARALEMVPVKDLGPGLAPGAFGIMEPAAGTPLGRDAEVVLVPGLSFDRARQRLGYGGGYYDHYLAAHPDSFKIGCFFAEQEFPGGLLPAAEHDIALDMIITEKGTL